MIVVQFERINLWKINFWPFLFSIVFRPFVYKYFVSLFLLEKQFTIKKFTIFTFGFDCCSSCCSYRKYYRTLILNSATQFRIRIVERKKKLTVIKRILYGRSKRQKKQHSQQHSTDFTITHKHNELLANAFAFQFTFFFSIMVVCLCLLLVSLSDWFVCVCLFVPFHFA